MSYRPFYQRLFAAFEQSIGRIDKDTIVALIGFDAGGPLNFCTIGRDRGDQFVTYLSCELAVRPEQRPSEFGRYELMISCDNEEWARWIVSDIGRMSLETAFGNHHSLDIGPWVPASDPIQGVVFEKACATELDGARYGILRCIGITRKELEFALELGPVGSAILLERLQKAGVYPNTSLQRESAV
jgi:hypothetical protein